MGIDKDIQEHTSKLKSLTALWHRMMHGDENEVIDTESGQRKSVEGRLVEIRAFMNQQVGDLAAALATALGYRDEAKAAKTSAQSARDTANSHKNTAKGYKDQAAGSATAAAESLSDVEERQQDVIDRQKQIVDERDSQINAIQTEGTTQKNAVNSAGNSKLSAISTEGAEQKSAVESAGSSEISAIQSEGSTQKSNVTSEGSKQVQAVKSEGNDYISAIETEGANQKSAVTGQGNTEVNRVKSQGDTQVGGVKAEGDSQVARVVAEGDAQEQRLAQDLVFYSRNDENLSELTNKEQAIQNLGLLTQLQMNATYALSRFCFRRSYYVKATDALKILANDNIPISNYISSWLAILHTTGTGNSNTTSVYYISTHNTGASYLIPVKEGASSNSGLLFLDGDGDVAAKLRSHPQGYNIQVLLVGMVN